MSALPFTAPWLLAPMEGVTEPCFRDLVLASNPPEHLGGAFTEFVRVSRVPAARRTLRAHLGPADRAGRPVGLQLMGSDPAVVAETARRALAVGAPLVDLNFGCPSKGALRGCAGSSLLDDPAAIERMVAAVAEAGREAERPVTAKVRAGGDDDRRLEEIVAAAQAGGAAMVTVHCRTRAEGYRDTADWGRLARAVAATSIPVCGNGGVDRHPDLERMRRATGCRYAMVGRAALGDPWVFSGVEVGAAEAAGFLLEYAERLARTGRSPRAVSGRVKQLLHHWRAGGLLRGARRAWLRERDPVVLLGRLRTEWRAERDEARPLRSP